jgi:hypothetical protein
VRSSRFESSVWTWKSRRCATSCARIASAISPIRCSRVAGAPVVARVVKRAGEKIEIDNMNKTASDVILRFKF